jgi:putative spermidine/putrescine transport system permease protein
MWEDIRHTVDPTIAALSSLLLLLPLLVMLVLTVMRRRLGNRVTPNPLEMVS